MPIRVKGLSFEDDSGCLLAGGDFLSDLDRARDDHTGLASRAVEAPPASTTARTLAQRFGPDELAGIEAAWVETAARAVILCDPLARARLTAPRPGVDLDSTEIEVRMDRRTILRLPPTATDLVHAHLAALPAPSG